jgi:hypothetical protein
MPDAPVRVGREPKFLVHVRFTAPDSFSRDIKWVRGDEDISMQVLGRSRHDGKGPKQNVVWGIHPGTKKPYAWLPDSKERTLFDLRPEECPIVDLEVLLVRMDEALTPLGWSRKARAAAGAEGRPEDALGLLAGDEELHMASWARKLIAEGRAKLSGMAEKTGRGDVVFELLLKVAPVIASGALSVEEPEEAIAGVCDWAAVERDFGRGLNAPVDMERNWSVLELKRYRDFAPAREQSGADPPPLAHPLARRFGDAAGLKLIW